MKSKLTLNIWSNKKELILSKFTSKIDSYTMITINGCILCRMKQKYFSGSIIRVPDPVNIKIIPKTPIYKLKNRKVTGRYYQIE